MENKTTKTNLTFKKSKPKGSLELEGKSSGLRWGLDPLWHQRWMALNGDFDGVDFGKGPLLVVSSEW